MAVTDPHRPELVALAKVTRLISTLDAGLTELNHVHPDDEARRRLIAAYKAALVEVASAVSDPLVDELVALHVEPLDAGASVAELKVAHAQLLGWVIGLELPQSEIDDALPLDRQGGGSTAAGTFGPDTSARREGC